MIAPKTHRGSPTWLTSPPLWGRIRSHRRTPVSHEWHWRYHTGFGGFSILALCNYVMTGPSQTVNFTLPLILTYQLFLVYAIVHSGISPLTFTLAICK